MPGIVAEVGFGGLPVGSVGVTNAYTPPGTFTVTCALRYYGSDCNITRYNPQQINAFQSEMLCLAATLCPNGTWNCNSVCNLATAFACFINNYAPYNDCLGQPLLPGSQIPRCLSSPLQTIDINNTATSTEVDVDIARVLALISSTTVLNNVFCAMVNACLPPPVGVGGVGVGGVGVGVGVGVGGVGVGVGGVGVGGVAVGGVAVGGVAVGG